ncbi:MAG: flagellar export chaperone FlgN [Tepidisphaeraceae bacterium]
MAPLQSQLEVLLKQILVEHRALLQRVDAHEAALRSYNPEAIEKTARELEVLRQRIGLLEAHRRVVTQQLAPKFRSDLPTLSKLAELFPDRSSVLLSIRDELKGLAEQIQKKSAVLARIASGVMNHLNSTVRLIAKAATGPSVYTRSGGEPLPRRVGVIEAVG